MAKKFVDHTDDPDKIHCPPPLPHRDSKGKLMDWTEDEILEYRNEADAERREAARKKFFDLVISKMHQFKMETTGSALTDVEARRRAAIPPPPKATAWPGPEASAWGQAVRVGKYIMIQVHENRKYLIALKHNCGDIVRLEVRGEYAYTYHDSSAAKGRSLWGSVSESEFLRSLTRLIFAGDEKSADLFLRRVKQTLFL